MAEPLQGVGASQNLRWGGAAALLSRMAEAPDDAARAALLQAALESRLPESRTTTHHAAMHAAQMPSDSGIM